MDLEKKIINLGYLLVLIILFATIAGIFEQFIFFVKALPFLLLFYLITSVSLSILRTKNFSFRKFVSAYKYDLLVFLFLTIFSFINASFYHETISGSRDDGIYSMNAVYLARYGTNSLRFLPQVDKLLGKSDNLGFLPGYHSYLAIFMYYFGLKNMLMFGNALLYLFSITCIYLVGKNLYGRKIAIISILFFITNYVSLWFSRRTNNENLGLFLFWFMALLFIHVYKSKNFKNFLLLIPTLITFFFVRGEAISLILPVLFIIFIILVKKRSKINRISLNIRKTVILFYVVNLAVIIVSVYSFVFYYKNNNTFFEGSAKNIKMHVVTTLGRISATTVNDLKLANSPYTYSPPVYQDFTTHATRYVFDVLKAYFLLQFLFLGLISIRKINLNLIIIVAMSAPFFAFLIYPAITPDNPWMMRKYWIAFIPFVYIIFGYFVNNNNLRKKIKILMIFLLFITQLYLSLPVVVLAENRGLIDSLDKLVKQIPSADLIITPRSNPAGWYYPIWIYYNIPSRMPYLNKDFENLESFKTMLKRFNNIYILASDWYFDKDNIYFENLSYPAEKLELIDISTIGTKTLAVVGSELSTLTNYKYDFIKEIITRLPPNTVAYTNLKISIFKVKK